ncbi:MAG TPA: response regulator [Stellaceae bacterium]|nr:response regulator [Stellaceae bacterium]
MRRILVVDDQAHVRAAILSVLRVGGYSVVGVADGPSALKAFEEMAFDLAIIDIYMPGLDGVKVIKKLRECAPALPIIAMSGMLLNDSQITALDFFPNARAMSGVVCLKKPFRAGEVLAAIEEAMALSATVSG